MKHQQRTGFTLIELLIALVLAVGAIGTSVLIVTTTLSRAFQSESSVAALDVRAWRALETINDRLETANATDLPLMALPQTEIDYRRIEDFVAGSPVYAPWEKIVFRYSPSDPDDGVDNDGNGLIDEGRVVWVQNVGLPNERTTLLTNWVSEELEGEIPGNNLDDNGNGVIDERGLCFVREGDSVTVMFTLQRTVGEGTMITRTVQRTISLRNTTLP